MNENKCGYISTLYNFHRHFEFVQRKKQLPYAHPGLSAKLLDFRDSGHLPSDMFTFASISDIFRSFCFCLCYSFKREKYTRSANKSPEYYHRNVTTDHTQQYHTTHGSRMNINGHSQEVIAKSYRKMSLLSHRENSEWVGCYR